MVRWLTNKQLYGQLLPRKLDVPNPFMLCFFNGSLHSLPTFVKRVVYLHII